MDPGPGLATLRLRTCLAGARSGWNHSYSLGRDSRSKMRLFILTRTLGGGAGALQWASSTAKWHQRVRLIAATDAPPSTAFNLCNSRAHRIVSVRAETFRVMSAAAVLKTEHLSFASVWLDRPWADWWDNHPVANSLSFVFAGVAHSGNREKRWHVHHSLSSCVPRIVKEVQVEEAEFLASQSPNKKLKFQRALYTRLLEELYPDDIVLTIRMRINKCHPEAALRLTDAMLQELETFFVLLASCLCPAIALHLVQWPDYISAHERSIGS